MPGNVGLPNLWLLNLRLLNVRTASFGSRSLLNLWLLNIRAASLSSRKIGLSNLRLRPLSAAAMCVNPGIIGINGAANYFVVWVLIAGTYRCGARAGIGSGATNIVVIYATMDAVVAVERAIVNVPVKDVAVRRHITINIVDVNVVEMHVGAGACNPNRPSNSPAVVKDAMMAPVAIMIEP